MTATSKAGNMSLKLLEVIERAKRDPEHRFLSLAHLIDVEALRRAHARLRAGAAAGVDGVTKEQYGGTLDRNLTSLHERLRCGQYRHQPVRRVHIPKAPGQTRPIGISTTEDKVVQEALREVLEAIYEPVFSDDSYGFRPGRSAHQALRALDKWPTSVSWILETDIQSYFDSIDRKMLLDMLREKVGDTSLLRLVGKCMHVGVLDGEQYSKPEEGTAQGSVLSPILGNVYLHHVLDRWLEHDVRPRLRGRVFLVRYADDLVLGFEREEDARRVMTVLPQRFGRFGLSLHPEKTRLLPFRRPGRRQTCGKGSGTFDFLGFTHYWGRTTDGAWRKSLKTRMARLRRAIASVAEYCRRHRHDSVKEQHAALVQRVRGHFNYFGVNGNVVNLRRLLRATERLWWKWLGRRGQRKPMRWGAFQRLLERYPLPQPKVYVPLWTR